MTFDARVPAREKTAFGNFQLRPTHLKTGVIITTADPTEFQPDEDDAANLRAIVAGRMVDLCPNYQAAVADTAMLLDMLGIQSLDRTPEGTRP